MCLFYVFLVYKYLCQANSKELRTKQDMTSFDSNDIWHIKSTRVYEFLYVVGLLNFDLVSEIIVFKESTTVPHIG